MTTEVVLLYAPFFGWLWGLPDYVRKLDREEWVEPAWVTWILTAPFVGFWFFVLLVVKR